MLKITQRMCIILVLFLSACVSKPTAQAAASLGSIPKITNTQPAVQNTSAPVLTAIPTLPAQSGDQPLSQLKGKLVKDKQTFLLLLGMGPITNPELNYQFTESYHFPHDRIKQDFRLVDSKGKTLDFEEIDPYEINVLNEEPLGPGIFDPRVFRFSQVDVSGPITLEVVNLVKGVTLASPLPEKIKLNFDSGFPMEKQRWDIQQTVQIIADAPFTIKYFNPIGFNKTPWCNENIKTFFRGTFYLEAPGYEYIQFDQAVPPERKSEFPLCGGGSGDHICSDYANCLISDTNLITTSDNQYELQISAYTQVIHGPWQVQFDLPQ
jgi:hypothetical protein